METWHLCQIHVLVVILLFGYSASQTNRKYVLEYMLFVCLMVLSATFNNISMIYYIAGSVLLVEETGGPGENHRSVASHWKTWSHNVVYLTLIEIQTHNISGDRHWLHR
jgi:hypothetical protein